MAATSERDLRSVFVRGLPFDLADAELEDAFARLGPVKSAFAVKDANDALRNRGFGIVQYALAEDAQRAVEEMDGTSLCGRKLHVELARKRSVRNSTEEMAHPRVGSVVPKSPEAPPTDGVVRKRTGGESTKGNLEQKGPSQKQKVARTVALGNLSEKKMEAAIQWARQQGDVVNVLPSAPKEEVAKRKLEQDGCKGAVAFVEYGSVSQAMKAVAALHGRKLPGGGRLWARQLGGEGAKLKRWRVIVRNLPFDAKEEDLRSAFKSCGLVWEITIPQKPDGGQRGFAFVGFISAKQARDAIEKVNGQTISNRRVAVDWALSKHDYEERTELPGDNPPSAVDRQATKAPQAGKDKGTGDGPVHDADLSEEKAESSEDLSGGENIAEEIAKPKVSKDEEKSTTSVAVDKVMAEEDDNPAMKGTESSPSTKSRESKKLGKAESKSKDVKATTQSFIHPIRPTVYVRNLPSSTTKEDLLSVMNVFGIVRECRVVFDKVTKKCNGTAYVEFVEKACAELVLQAANDPNEGGVRVKGKAVQMSPALSAEEARKLKKELATEDKREKSRNLHLSKEGVIAEGSKEWQELSASDQEKRRNGEREKKTKLASPNFTVSATRLSVRNIPLDMSEKQLKEIFTNAVKEKATKQNPQIKQVKILRNDEKVGKDGLPLSKGLGFVEFKEHQHAIVALRSLNNNPKVFKRDRRPIVEFAIENAKVLRARSTKIKGTATGKIANGNSPKQLAGQGSREGTALKPPGNSAERRSNHKKQMGAGQREASQHRQPEKGMVPGSNGIASNKTQKRKQDQDARIDSLAQARPVDNLTRSESRREKKRQKKNAPEENFETLVKQYKAKYFGLQDGNEKREKRPLSRWFE